MMIPALAIIVGAMPAFAVEQTICFSKQYSGSPSQYFPKGVPMAVLGDDVVLYGGKCEGKKLGDMNKAGYKLVQVVTGLESSFGMVFEKGGK